MDTKEIIQDLCKKRGVTVQRLEIEVGESQSSISKVSSNSKALKLYKIAQFFGVSMEYLITGKEPDAGMILSQEEKDLIFAYRNKSDDAKDVIAASLGVKRQDTGLRSSSKAV